MLNRRVLVLALLLGGLVLPGVGGCASAPLAPSADPSAMGASVEASKVYAPGPREKRYVDARSGKTQVRRFGKAAADGSWTMTSADASVIDKEPKVGVAIQVLTFEPLSDGGVGLRDVIDYGENAITTYTPPLVLMPKVLGPEGWETSSRVRLTWASRPDEERSTGDAKLSLKIISATGQGDERRVRLSQVLKISLPPADVTEEELREVGPKGIVSEQERRRVEVGFLTIQNESHDYTLQNETE